MVGVAEMLTSEQEVNKFVLNDWSNAFWDKRSPAGSGLQAASAPANVINIFGEREKNTKKTIQVLITFMLTLYIKKNKKRQFSGVDRLIL